MEELQTFSNKLMEKIKKIDDDKREIEKQIQRKESEEKREEEKLNTLRSSENLLKVGQIEFRNKLDNSGFW